MYREKFELGGRVAVVTGGAQGIGFAAASALAEAGARLVLADRDAGVGAAAAKRIGHGAEFVLLDVTDRAGVRATAAALIARLGQVDILVNSAGIARNTPAEETTDDEWREIMDINLNGTFWCCREFGRAMVARGKGAIVNIGSMSGLIVNKPQPQAAYNASKAAVHMLTKSLAAEWADKGVRVNAVAPGYIGTALTVRGMSNPVWKAAWLDNTPMHRVGEPEEIAAVILFLASDAASYVTGSVLSADGGYTAW